jgi:hypothetical protein
MFPSMPLLNAHYYLEDTRIRKQHQAISIGIKSCAAYLPTDRDAMPQAHSGDSRRSISQSRESTCSFRCRVFPGVVVDKLIGFSSENMLQLVHMGFYYQ